MKYRRPRTSPKALARWQCVTSRQPGLFAHSAWEISLW